MKNLIEDRLDEVGMNRDMCKSTPCTASSIQIFKVVFAEVLKSTTDSYLV